jgi:chromosome segregation ATPase
LQVNVTKIADLEVQLDESHQEAAVIKRDLEFRSNEVQEMARLVDGLSHSNRNLEEKLHDEQKQLVSSGRDTRQWQERCEALDKQVELQRICLEGLESQVLRIRYDTDRGSRVLYGNSCSLQPT